MVVQPTAEPGDIAVTAVEYEKERQIVEKCLSTLSSPIVRNNFEYVKEKKINYLILN